MTGEGALAALRALADPERAEGMAAYHKVDRPYLGLSNAAVTDLATAWRKALSLDERVALARDLWASDVYEARIAAGKLFLQARIRPDDGPAWACLTGFVPEFDSWAIADAVAQAGQKRVVADPARLDEIEGWTRSDHMWTRRAALVFTLPFTKSRHPRPAEEAARDRILGWCAGYAEDPDWFIQKAVAWWVRDLSKKDRSRAQAFLQTNGPRLKPWARKEAARHLGEDTAPTA
ncbi:DNA alkylation repair protein [Roseibacterium sp. SDUM158016]|uniref:DNA alkylation repair protein n=1 Tax=Roseicyclus sediminis TaxID=2980997 RepID=UPI0021D27A75|nr:DNA alkylation repair protein [Roseibacterium sp. SDUM158016]MCU4653968.1 DNA alkylation repair protein [Roseibacterium sp. SDUM158016]